MREHEKVDAIVDLIEDVLIKIQNLKEHNESSNHLYIKLEDYLDMYSQLTQNRKCSNRSSLCWQETRF